MSRVKAHSNPDIGDLFRPAGGRARARGSKVRGSIATVAGEYYYGDGLGMNCSLTITQEGRFSFKWQGCEG